MALVDDVGFDHSFSFVYSPRPGTPAAQLPDETAPAEKLARLQRLQARIEAQGNAISGRGSAASRGSWSRAGRATTPASRWAGPSATGWSTSPAPKT